MRFRFNYLISVLLCVPMWAQTCQKISLGPNGALNGFVPSPNDAWHQDISAAPVDPTSTVTTTDVAGTAGWFLHPDFGASSGIPYNVVDSSMTPNVPVNFVTYASDSDTNLYPLTQPMSVEGGMPASPFDPNNFTVDGGDHHLIALDRNQCVDYELWRAGLNAAGWVAANGAVWDLTKTEQRPYGLTSTDAAGLSVFSGLIRYDEILAGQINHAIRFTMRYTKDDANGGFFTAPASHAAGNNWGNNNIIGMRIRLKASFDISGYSPTNQIILKAMKQYGMILADNGTPLYFQGTTDSRWSDTDLNGLKNVPGTAFEVVTMNPMYDSATAPKGAAPVIASFTASAATVAAGTPVTLSYAVTGSSYEWIDLAGFVRGGTATVTPAATTTYTLSSRNLFGTATRQVTVTVAAPVPTPPPAPTPVPVPVPTPTPVPTTTYQTAYPCFASDGTFVWRPKPCSTSP